ncbi:hypothetical protein QR680_005558 [Steinernema hermaphroditum]|uniref:Ground-like domain-containing protein n=1 Tax=Steinernema hermaphroditum TaxID=289476 RepID=A0AA39LVV7_9BILA|nr:hypothetical protein QR680_005558 [Steinernema hermaphroditum]
MRSVVLLSALYFASGSAFFFPSLGGGAAGCNCQTQPACPPAPVCSPAPAPVCPPPPSCGAPCSGGSCGGGPSYSGPVSSGCSGAGCGGEAVYAPSSGCSGPSCGGGSSSGCSGASCGGGQSYAASASGGCSGGACGGASVQQFQALPVQQPVLNQQQQPAPVPIAPIPVTNYASVPAPAAVYQQQAQPVPAPQPTYQQPQPVAQQTYQQQPQQVPVEKNPVSVEPSPLRSEGYTSSGEQYVQPEQANHAAAGDRLQEVVDEDVAPSSVAEASAEANETLSHEVAEPIPISELKLTEDALCNNEELRKLMLDNIEENLNTSKRLIQVAAETAFGGRFDVICSNQDFSYITNTLLFCQETKGDVSCYTYRQL